MDFKKIDLGLIEYTKAFDFQRQIFEQVKSGQLESALIFCRHYPVITLGRLAKKENILVSEEVLKKRGVALYETNRGGDVTYHGPGQLTIYPIINLNYFKKDIHWFLRNTERLVIEFLADFGLKAQSKSGLTGVWVGNNKICSIGIGIKNWITFHGLSINIKEDDLDNFKLIRPCGMDIEMTCLESELGRKIDIDDVQGRFSIEHRSVPYGDTSPIDREPSLKYGGLLCQK